MLRKFFVWAVLLFTATNVNSQIQFNLKNWSLTTSLSTSNAVEFDKTGRLWCGSTGGLYVYNRQDGALNIFNSASGLLNNDVSSLYYSREKSKMLVGLRDGTLEIFDQEYKITHITSIRDANFAKPNINKFLGLNTKVYIAGGFGLTSFDIETELFITTAERIASWTKNTELNDILVFDNKLWVCSELGIAFCPLDKLIEVPNNWTIFSTVDGLEQTNVKSLALYNNQLYASSENYIFKFDGAKFQKTGQFGPKITSMLADDDLLIVLENGLSNLSKEMLYEGAINGATKDPEGAFVLYTKSGLMFYKSKNEVTSYLPNSPRHNIFSGIEILSDGSIWTIAAHVGNRSYEGGISLFRDGVWQNFTTQEFPEFATNVIFELNKTSKDKIYAGTWGSGLAVGELENANAKFDMFTAKNSKFVGMNDDGFMLGGTCKEDQYGNVWCVNYAGLTTGPFLVTFNADGTSDAYTNCYASNERRLLKLAIDNFGTKWVGSFPGEGRGIFYFNENGTPQNSSDDKCGLISTSTYSALPDNSPTAMEADSRGNIWLGFGSGLSVILNPSAVMSSNPNLIIRSVKLMNSQKINDILIDPVGLIWLGTSTGVWVLDKDATQVVSYINKSNSPLIDENVLSIALDENSGRVYFGTESGLFSATSLSVLPNDAYDLICYPQPFNLKKQSEMTIDGLTSESEVKIVTINGEHIKTIKAQGRKAIWDGKNENEQKVQSGVYLVVPASSVSNSSSVQKIAVINE